MATSQDYSATAPASLTAQKAKALHQCMSSRPRTGKAPKSSVSLSAFESTSTLNVLALADQLPPQQGQINDAFLYLSPCISFTNQQNVEWHIIRIVIIIEEWLSVVSLFVFSKGIDLLDQIRPLIVKLFVLSISMKIRQEPQQLVLVTTQDRRDRWWFMRICDKHLEHVERLELNVLALVPECFHYQSQVFGRRNVSRHDRVIASVQDDLAEEFERLSPCDIVR